MNKKIVSVVAFCSLVLTQFGCAKNRDATGGEVSLGLFGGAVTGAIIGASTPATLAGALLGTILGIAIIDLSDDEVEMVLEPVELTPDLSPIVVEQTPSYMIRPVNTFEVAGGSRTAWCRDATIKRLGSMDQETILTKLCRDDDHWFLQSI